MFGAEPMTVPHSGIQYAQPSSWKEPGGIFRLAASACAVMPIAVQIAAVIAIIRAIVWLTNKTGRINVAQRRNHIPRLRFVDRMPALDQKRTFAMQKGKSTLPPKAVCGANRNVQKRTCR
jgi:hypothetical protein